MGRSKFSACKTINLKHEVLVEDFGDICKLFTEVSVHNVNYNPKKSIQLMQSTVFNFGQNDNLLLTARGLAGANKIAFARWTLTNQSSIENMLLENIELQLYDKDLSTKLIFDGSNQLVKLVLHNSHVYLPPGESIDLGEIPLLRSCSKAYLDGGCLAMKLEGNVKLFGMAKEFSEVKQSHKKQQITTTHEDNSTQNIQANDLTSLVQELSKKMTNRHGKNSKPKHLADELAWIQEVKCLKKLSDCAISNNDIKLPCQSRILALCSGYFKNKMKLEEDLEGTTWHLDDIETELLEILHKFFYTGMVDDMEKNALELFKIALDYEIPNLVEQCSDYLQGALNMENCNEILILAHVNNIKALEEKAFDFLLANPRVINKNSTVKSYLKSIWKVAVGFKDRLQVTSDKSCNESSVDLDSVQDELELESLISNEI